MNTPDHRGIWRIAAPLILTNITAPLLGMVDTAVVGHLSEPHYLGAVAVGATVFSFLFLGLNFLRMGTTGLAAQALGTGRRTLIANVLGQALITAIAMAALLLVLQAPLRAASLWLIAPELDVAKHTRIYFDIRIWAAPAALANYALIGWFIGLHNGRAPLAMALVINLVNIVLDFWLVVGLGMKTDGVAYATVAAEFTGAALGGLLAWRFLRKLRADADAGSHANSDANSDADAVSLFDAARFRALFHINANLFVRTITLMFAFGFFTAMGARQGETILAANAVLMNFQYFMASGLDALANAAEAFVGRAVGLKDRAQEALAVRLSMIWSAGVAGVFALGWLVGGVALINLLTDLQDVRLAAYSYLPWLVASPLISVWSFLYDGVFVGATMARQMRNAMLFSLLAVYLPAWALLTPFGNHGLWLAFLCFMAARGASMHWIYRHRRPV